MNLNTVQQLWPLDCKMKYQVILYANQSVFLLRIFFNPYEMHWVNHLLLIVDIEAQN